MGWIAGTALLIRKEALNQVGGFDEKLFMYAEDLDLSNRMHQQGWLLYTCADAKVTHLGQGSGSSEKAILGEFSGLRYLFGKAKSSFDLIWLRFILKTGALLRIIVFGIILGRKHYYEIYKKAFSLA
jgi:GT2 family glycosyltransferase